VQPSRSTRETTLPEYRVTLYSNGALDGGVGAELPRGLCDFDGGDATEALAAWAWTTQAAGRSAGDADNSDRCAGCALYDATARRVESCADLAETATPLAGATTRGVDLWVVPAEKWFVFPTGSLGRAVGVPRVPPPKGAAYPITVETISHSPRVFHLHNFLTAAESDALIAYALNNKDPILGLQQSTTGAEHQVSFNKVTARCSEK
jgi:hypothetical protein